MNAPLPRASFERLPVAELRSPSLRAVMTLWQGKCGGRVAPARRDFDPLELKPVLPWVSLIDVHHDPLDFTYRLVGTEMVHSYGSDVTGLSVRALKPQEFGALVWRDLCELIETRQPQLAQLQFLNPAGFHRIYQILRLPLSTDGETIDMILLVAQFAVSPEEFVKLAGEFNAS